MINPLIIDREYATIKNCESSTIGFIDSSGLSINDFDTDLFLCQQIYRLQLVLLETMVFRYSLTKQWFRYFQISTKSLWLISKKKISRYAPL